MPDLESLKAQAGNYLQSEDFKKLTPYLLSGGAGALAGGAMSGRRREERGESRTGYLGRILRNALVTGSLAGGSHYLLGRAVNGAQDPANAIAAPAGPAESNIARHSTNPLLALGSGGLGLKLSEKWNMLGANLDKAPINAASFRDKTGLKEVDLVNDGLGTAVAKRLKEMKESGVHPDKLKEIDRLRRLGGIPSALKADGTTVSKLKGAGSAVTRGALKTFGQSGLTRAKRVGVGTLAALIPALVGSFANSGETAA